MSLSISKIFKKGLQSQLNQSVISNCALSFTTDTRRLYVEDGSNRLQITDVIFGMTQSEIVNNANPLPKFYVASDTLNVYVSDGSTIDKVGYVPTQIGSLETQNYYPLMTSSDGTTNLYGYTQDMIYNPSTKELKVGAIRTTQTTDSNTGDITIDLYAVSPTPVTPSEPEENTEEQEEP